MDKEELLEQSRQQNKNADLVTQEAVFKGSQLAYSIGLLIASLLFLLEILVLKTQNYAIMIVWMSMESVLFIYKYIKVRKTHELIFAIIFTICTVGMLVCYLLTMFKVM